MAKPFKFRYVNELAGSFVLIVLALAIGGLVLTWRAQGWFEKTYAIDLVCPPEGSFGLTEGSAIEIMDIRVGAVEKVEVDDDGTVHAMAHIKGAFFEKFIRTDSKALVKKRFMLAGDAFLDITKGALDQSGKWVGQPLPAKGARLYLEKDTEITEMAKQLVERLRSSVVPAIDEIRLTAEEARKTVASLREPEGNLQQFLRRLNEFADRLQHGEGVVPQVLNDRKLADDLHAVVTNVNEVLGEVDARLKEAQGILTDIKDATARLPGMAEKVGQETQDLPGLILQTQETVRDIGALVDGLQKHWLVRGYMEPPRSAEPLPPAAVSGEEAIR